MDGEFDELLLKRIRTLLGGQEDSAAAAVLTASDWLGRALEMRRLVEVRLAALAEERKFLESLPVFAAKLGADHISLPLLLARLEFLKQLGSLEGHGPAAPRPGFGRGDAFTSARNFLFEKDEARSPIAPVRYPILWGFDKRWLHWDGNTMSVMERKVGQALGLGGVADPVSKSSALLPGNLHDLETVAKKLLPPAWPDAFGKIDRASDEFKAGEQLYVANCAACHEKQEVMPKYGKKVLEGGVVYVNIGTDDARTKVRRPDDRRRPVRGGRGAPTAGDQEEGVRRQ
ncbi:MAG: cytochrome c [Planctomycetes bacterium]|nr:cytochrome c [Planctomycetota bacterium]